MFTVFRFLQYENTPVPNDDMFPKMFTDVKLLQWLNTSFPTEDTLSGIINDIKPLFLNEKFPMEITLFGIKRSMNYNSYQKHYFQWISHHHL